MRKQWTREAFLRPARRLNRDNVRDVGDGDAALEAWEARLREAEQDLRSREERALADGPSPGELLALSARRDEIARDRDTLADVYDDRVRNRDRSGLHRDVRGSGRDRTARDLAQDADPGWADRLLAGEDRDFAAGDRGDSFDDRGRSRACGSGRLPTASAQRWTGTVRPSRRTSSRTRSTT